MYIGSHAKNVNELVNYLRSVKMADGTPKYNLTVLFWPEGSRIKEGENVHLIKFVEPREMYISD